MRRCGLQTFIYPGVLGCRSVHRGLLGGFDRVGQGVRISPRDCSWRRCDAPLCDRQVLGGATICDVQGIRLLALAWFAHVPYNVVLLLTLIGELLLLSFT